MKQAKRACAANRAWVVGFIAGGACSSLALAQVVGGGGWGGGADPLPPGPTPPTLTPGPLPMRLVDVGLDSGPVSATGGPVNHLQRVWTATVREPGAEWVRLMFGAVELAGPRGTERSSMLRVVSLRDGKAQTLWAEDVERWGNSSAYFNGDSVRVEVWSAAGTGASRVVVAQVMADDGPAAFPQDLCGPDDREASTDPRQGRLISNQGICTAFMINDTNRQFLTAGHCAPLSSTNVVQFNVPRSTASGTIQNPGPEDQYPIDPTSVQRATSGTNNDWCYFGVFANSNTGLMPAQRSGGWYVLANALPPADGRTVVVTGYGTSSADFTLNQAQKTGSGPLSVSSGDVVRYFADTTASNSGSPVVDVLSGAVIGVHYFAGCLNDVDTGLPMGPGNMATGILNANLRAALNAPLGITRTGRGTVAGSLFAIGDQANNFGTVNPVPNGFAQVAQIGTRWNGLAWDSNARTFWATDRSLGLWRVSRDGTATPAATITGTGAVIVGGLAVNPTTGTVFALGISTGQLFTLNTSTGAASPVGALPAGSSTWPGLEWEPASGQLLAIENQAGNAGTRLWRIDSVAGSRTLVGALGANIVNCGDLGLNLDDGQLYTVNINNNSLFRINAQTGAATNLGWTRAAFSTTMGLAFGAALRRCPADFNNDGQVNTDDISDFITDYFSVPAAAGPGGYALPCADAPDAPAPLPIDAYRLNGFRCDVQGDCMLNADDLSDFITAYFLPC